MSLPLAVTDGNISLAVGEDCGRGGGLPLPPVIFPADISISIEHGRLLVNTPEIVGLNYYTERIRQRQHDNFLQLRLMLSTLLILDCVNVYLRLDLLDIMAEIRKTDSNDSHLYKHDIQPALSKQIFPANSKYTLWSLYCNVQSDNMTR